MSPTSHSAQDTCLRQQSTITAQNVLPCFLHMLMKPITTLLGLWTAVFLVLNTPCWAEVNIVFADSVNDFAGVQGKHNWYYGYMEEPLLDSQNFRLITNFADVPYDFGKRVWLLESGKYWTAIGKYGAHPNGLTGNSGRVPIVQWAVRRWLSDVAGRVEISGQYGSLGGSSATVRILVDGAAVWTNSFPAGSPIKRYKLTTPVQIGSLIDFVVDAGMDNSDVSDHILFTAKITPGNKPGVRGLVQGVTQNVITCRNITTGQMVQITGATTWNCTTAGLVVKTGDQVSQTAAGIAQ